MGGEPTGIRVLMREILRTFGKIERFHRAPVNGRQTLIEARNRLFVEGKTRFSFQKQPVNTSQGRRQSGHGVERFGCPKVQFDTGGAGLAQRGGLAEQGRERVARGA